LAMAPPAHGEADPALLFGEGAGAAGLLLGWHIDRHQGTPLADLAALRWGDNPLAHQVVERFIKAPGRRAGQAVAAGAQGGQGRRTRRRQLGGEGGTRPVGGGAAAGFACRLALDLGPGQATAHQGHGSQ